MTSSYEESYKIQDLKLPILDTFQFRNEVSSNLSLRCQLLCVDTVDSFDYNLYIKNVKPDISILILVLYSYALLNLNS